MVMFVEMELFRLNVNSDADADHQSFGWWSVHGLIECRLYELYIGGPTNFMESGLKLDCRSW